MNNIVNDIKTSPEQSQPLPPLQETPLPQPPASPLPLPTPPPIQPPVPTAPPPVTPTPQPQVHSKKKLALLAIGAVVLVAVLGVAAFLFVGNSKKGSAVQTDLNKGGKSALLSMGEDLSKYDKDTDNDGYPDFIESAVGLNPNESEFARCSAGKDCQAGQPSSVDSGKKNIVLILDASGSMGLSNSGQTRMDAAKSAIKGYVSQASSDPNVSIGLMVYGHKGSNSTADKPASCASAEIIAPLGSVSSTTIDSYLAGVKPTGWTPMGLAITNAQSVFTGKEADKNQMILITDGDETCNSNPAGAAASAHNSAAKISVDVIGFAVSTAEQSTLNAIATSGGGDFSVANDSNELIRKMDQQLENLKKVTAKANCDLNAYETFLPCENEHYNKILNFITTRRSSYFKKEISKAEYDKLNALYEQTYSLHRNRADKGTKAER